MKLTHYSKWSLNEAGDGGQVIRLLRPEWCLRRMGWVRSALVVNDAPEVSGSALFPGLYDEEKCHRCG